MNEDKVTQVNRLFEKVFSKNADNDKINALLSFHDPDIVISALNYLIIMGVKPIKEGKKDNPYGLLHVICKTRDNYGI